MGTRGIWGLCKDGVTKETYNHWDSYPEGLGESLREFLRSEPNLNAIFDNIEMVSEDIPPTLTQQGELIVYFERVSTSLPTEWYALLRGTQGRPELYSDELKYMLDGSGMDYEWRYILNLDSLTVEIDHGSRRMSIPFGEFVDMDFDDLREDND